MQMNRTQMLITVLCLAGGTVLTRFLPFILFPEGKKQPKIISYLGGYLPPAMMGLLVIYCLRNTDISVYPNGIPELISVLFIIFVHLWKRNVLFSIASGTILYMFLLHKIF